jgi:hypothetical protein
MFTNKKSPFKTLQHPDPDFYITTGMYSTPRAGFQISKGCPEEYRNVIQTCIRNGWLMPVAHLKESEYIWEKIAE